MCGQWECCFERGCHGAPLPHPCWLHQEVVLEWVVGLALLGVENWGRHSVSGFSALCNITRCLPKGPLMPAPLNPCYCCHRHCLCQTQTCGTNCPAPTFCRAVGGWVHNSTCGVCTCGGAPLQREEAWDLRARPCWLQAAGTHTGQLSLSACPNLMDGWHACMA